MVSERRRIASGPGRGQGKAAEIRGQKERELKGIQSEAYRKARRSWARPTARRRASTRRVRRDRSFYPVSQDHGDVPEDSAADTTLILSTDGEFFRFSSRADRIGFIACARGLAGRRKRGDETPSRGGRRCTTPLSSED